MKILNIKVTNGPNYWSINKKRLVVMELDIEDLETQPTDEIKGFYQRIKKAIPSLWEHNCSEGVPGGFFSRVKRGTWMGHVVEHIGIEIQVLAGLQVGFGRARGTGVKGHYNVVFECVDAESGHLAAEKAVLIAQQLVDGIDIDINKHVNEIREMNSANMPGPSTTSLLKEAASRGIPYIRLEDRSTYQLGYGRFQKKIAATITSSTSNMAVELACDKEACHDFLKEMSVPVAEGDVVESIEELKVSVKSLGFPLVVKPVSGNQGRGVTTNIKSEKEAVAAFELAGEISERVIVERHISGLDYRLLTIDGKFVAAAKRTPAHVVGDGFSTIQQLINIVNKDSGRGENHDNILTKIKIGPSAISILSQKGYTLDTVLPRDKILYLDYAANLSKGGTAEDVTDNVHPEIAMMAARIGRMIGLDICGIDVMASTLNKPLHETGGVVLEVNAAPGFRMHLSPSKGKPRNVAAPVLDMLFPKGQKSRIPIIAVTGTNGKTTTTRLISHIMKGAGRKVGYTTTDGVYVNDELIMKGDCGGPKSAQIVLKDPGVDTAVLECARGGILRLGLGFDYCDVAVVTNVASDHLGMKGINDLKQMSSLKSVVPESVHPSGFAVLNADDDRVYSMRNRVRCSVVLFSLEPDNPKIMSHREAGGISVVLKDQYITILDGESVHVVEHVENIPLSFKGQAGFMIENIMASVAAAYTQNISPAQIGEMLCSFVPSPEKTPGRMNLFSFPNYDILVDYAHNPAGLMAVQQYLKSSSYEDKIGIVCGLGDRRDEDSIELGRIAAETFDKIIIREDSDLRGKAAGETTETIKKGIGNSPFSPSVVAIANEKEALQYAMENALPGTLIMLCVENIDEVISMMQKKKSEQQHMKSRCLKHSVQRIRIENNISAVMNI
ncbi:cyanophycin synthetase [Rhodohalobacter sp.]|uniref:cyanophycin synthetase n=1 Tax=Rhodohalobacter sp. TaxID=1974210 RepID=UPI002ACDA8D4|nr:cyanophycin synthetase [Rhodohalobacter sp.]MDZ7755804.1 cyanophycin synthetase [Rhodohalobacter sp.]